jgi:hypothetical protein
MGSLWGKLSHELITYSLELKLVMVKCLFFYTHANKTQEFNYKMNIVSINLESNIGMNGSIDL